MFQVPLMAQIDLTRRTKIVATIGPATESAERIRELVEVGATTFRLNFSHGDHDEHAKRISTIRQVSDELGMHSAFFKTCKAPKFAWVVLIRGLSLWPMAILSH